MPRLNVPNKVTMTTHRRRERAAAVANRGGLTSSTTSSTTLVAGDRRLRIDSTTTPSHTLARGGGNLSHHTSSTVPSTHNHQRRFLSQNGHAWLGSLRYGFPFAPQLGSFALQYGKVKSNHDSTAPPLSPSQVAVGSPTPPPRSVKMMRRPQKDLSELDIDDDAGLKFSFSHSASIRGIKGDVRVADMIIARRQVATKALLRLKVLEMASCARGDIRALYRGLAKDFEREKKEVTESFWARLPEDNMNWEGGNSQRGTTRGDEDDDDTSSTITTPFDSKQMLNDLIAAISKDHLHCRQREAEHLSRIAEVEASLLEMLDHTEVHSLPSTTCHLLRYLDSTRERVELIFSKKIDTVVDLFVRYHTKRQVHEASRNTTLMEEPAAASATGGGDVVCSGDEDVRSNCGVVVPRVGISKDLFTPPPPTATAATITTNKNEGEGMDIGSNNRDSLSLPIASSKSNPSTASSIISRFPFSLFSSHRAVTNQHDDHDASLNSTEACRTTYKATSKAIGEIKKDEPTQVGSGNTSSLQHQKKSREKEYANNQIMIKKGGGLSSILTSPDENIDDSNMESSQMSGEDLIREQQRRMYHRTLQEEADEVENLWEVRRKEREERWRELDRRISSADPSTATLAVSETATTGSLFLSAAAELGAVDGADREASAMVAEHTGVEGSQRLSTTEEAEEEEDENGGRRGTSELDELVLQDALIYSRALVFASGGSRTARDWIAGAGTLSSSNPALVRIALQHQGTLRDLQMFVSLCEITSCTHASIADRVKTICEEAIANGDSDQSAACRRRQAVDDSVNAMRVVCGGEEDSKAADILSPTSLLAEHVIFKEEQQMVSNNNTTTNPSSTSTPPEDTTMSTSSSTTTALSDEETSANNNGAQEYFYAKTPYSGAGAVSSSSSTSTRASVASTSHFNTVGRGAYARCFTPKQCSIISAPHLDLEFGDHSDFTPTGQKQQHGTTTAQGGGVKLNHHGHHGLTSVAASLDDSLSVELPIPFSPTEQVSILKRCLVYDSLCAACFMQPQWSLQNARDLCVANMADETLNPLPRSVAVDAPCGGSVSVDEKDPFQAIYNDELSEDDKCRRIEFPDDEGGDIRNESRILGRHPIAMGRGLRGTDEDEDAKVMDIATQSVMDAGPHHQQSATEEEDDDLYPVDDLWLNHSLYVRYFGPRGKRLHVPPTPDAQSGGGGTTASLASLTYGSTSVGVGAANDRHVRRTLACARRLEVDPDVVEELLSVVLEEENIVSEKQRVVGDVGGVE